MGLNITCLAENDPNRLYDYCPSYPLAITFAILFTGITFTHIILAIHFRKGFPWVLIMGSLWESAGYISRILSIQKQADVDYMTTQQLLILLAPLWINAFIYMTLGRTMHFFLQDDRVLGIRARKITLMFVLFDVSAFLVQLAGGMMTSGQPSVNTLRTGLKIYTGGVGLQLAFLTIFCTIAIRFLKQHSKQDRIISRQVAMESSQPYDPYSTTAPPADSIDWEFRTPQRAKPLLITVGIVLALIILRTLYRLIEYGMGGINGNVLTKHEAFLYVFDAVPMFLALLALAVYHPGRVLQGARSDFKSEDKMRKEGKKAEKFVKKQLKADKKALKNGGGVYMKVGEEVGSGENLV